MCPFIPRLESGLWLFDQIQFQVDYFKGLPDTQPLFELHWCFRIAGVGFHFVTNLVFQLNQ